jgi:hypothetical protein
MKRKDFIKEYLKNSYFLNEELILRFETAIESRATSEKEFGNLGVLLYDACFFESYRESIIQMFERDNAFFKALEKKPISIVSKRDMRFPLVIKSDGD